MSKENNLRREDKKKPLLSLKEKRAKKMEKKGNKPEFISDNRVMND